MHLEDEECLDKGLTAADWKQPIKTESTEGGESWNEQI